MEDDLTRASRELDGELRRVGVNISDLLDELPPEPPAGVVGCIGAVGFDLAGVMPVLRSLPDGAGKAAFLASCREHLTAFGGHRFGSD